MRARRQTIEDPLVRFRDPDGRARTGTWRGEEVSAEGETFHRADVHLLPPAEPRKIVGVCLNHRSLLEARNRDPPSRPKFFLKTPNTLVGHDRPVRSPGVFDRVDAEAELGVVVDRPLDRADVDEASEAIRGYTCANDLTNRDDIDRERSWVRTKCFDDATPLGPALVPPGSLDPDARLRLLVNGVEEQRARALDTVFSAAEALSEASSFMRWQPGDVLLLGSPAGPTPVDVGDRVAVEIEGVGTLRNTVEARGPPSP